jgi:N-acetylglucosaminylphosphatidylinositol deacetylase
MTECILIAHPDDEIMFFLPTVVALSKKEFWICCITHGSQGIRRGELQRIASRFNAKLHFLESSKFKDSQTTKWEISNLTELLGQFTKLHSISTIYTFDNGGVSGHVNHRELALAASRIDQSSLTVLHLKTHGILWKYCILSKWYPKCSKSSPIYTLNPVKAFVTSFECMRIHASQFVWYRFFYILFTCYTCVNEYHPELEI